MTIQEEAIMPNTDLNPRFSISLPETGKPRIVVIGGGFAGINMIKKLKNLDAQIILLDRHNYHTFQPLLYQVATAGLEPDSIAGPLRKIFEGHKNFFFRMATVQKIMPESNTLVTNIGSISYDYLVIATGSRTNYFGNKELAKRSLPLKQVPQALDMRSNILQNFEKAVLAQDPEEKASLMTYVIAGGGPTGVELCGSLGELRRNVLPADYPELDFSEMRIYLIEGTGRLLNGMSEFAHKRTMKYMNEFNIEVKLNSMVQDYDGKHVHLKDGTTIATQTFVWAAGVTGNLVDGLKDESIEKNRILVDEFSKAKGYNNIFALGDIAAMVSEENPKGHPMLAPVAIQQGKKLAKNFMSMFAKQKMEPFSYFDKGVMATFGRNRAVADLPNGWSIGGFFAWTAWLAVHLFFLIGFRNKLVTLFNWVWNYFTFDKSTRLIIRPFVKRDTTDEDIHQK